MTAFSKLKYGIRILALTFILGSICHTTSGIHADADDMQARYRSTIEWRDDEDSIAGWDWSLPPGTLLASAKKFGCCVINAD
ncbi:MAG: hypothetical protein AB3N63_06200 [Puniceicoccaceae bacterium]